jgi:hypothetical protein
VAELGRCGAAAGVLPLFRLVDYCRRWQRRPPIEVRVWMDFSSATIEVLGGVVVCRGGEGVAAATGG